LSLSGGHTESTGSTGTGSILGLTVVAVVVVGEALLVGSVEGREVTTSGGSGLSRSLIGEWLLDLLLRLADLLSEGIKGLLGLAVAGKVGEGLGSGSLRDRGQAGGGASSTCLRNTLVGRRERSTRGDRRVLGGLSTSLGLLTVVINVHGITVQSHAAELHGRTVNGMVAGHNNSLLLLHDTTLEARGTGALFQGTAGHT
jgi:hypothetical protein